ncbi:uncharacterized protein AC631_03803 [Debaryomyces fabryi]|uniref:37S ribosomal protein S22, mitochondrial n=1 Tax=Debaryomyces fabryi TaxID=58627 RepID=A0A0V1PVV6_9ASCO|nr:uncharacterized protein AC631_03803 [Debaryomyces fabryi]KSA00425.1 hypothetical protein AC631_03803 [Debaryomyces fabryi]CUM46498.1 unnamed protein product [Debaryomyces fabryi]
MIRGLSRRSTNFKLGRVGIPSHLVVRYKSTSKDHEKLKLDSSTYEFIKDDDFGSSVSSDASSLPFEMRRHGELFGQLVRSESLKKDNNLNEIDEDYVKRQNPEYEEQMYDSPFRNEDGSFIKGDTAEEARLHDLTLVGRSDRRVTILPYEIANCINNNILRLVYPDRLREKAAKIYQSLNKDQIQNAPETALDCDAHIAALFLQDYSHVHQVLLELQKRVGKDKFNPKSVLDIGYGPATGMVALNEIMGNDYIPDEKDAYIVGRNNFEMKKRAKIILSRQINENLTEEEEVEEEVTNDISEEQNVKEDGELRKEVESETQEMEENEGELEEEEYIGPVLTSDIKLKTKLRDSLPVTKKYDLIIVNQALLTREFNFPRDIDINIHMILKLLSPGGHLVLVERGNALGFETIARARQIMIRPESYETEIGKIPRPYIKGSKLKPQKLKKDDQLISEDDIKFEEELLAKYEREDEAFEQELNDRYGKPSEKDLKFEMEDSEDFEVIPVEEEPKLGTESVDFHLSIIAPCPHHGKCPLQLGDPKYYKIPSHKHRLNFCSFNKTVERPKYTMELKKGRRLSTAWDKSSEDGFGIDKLSKKTLQNLEGSGRPSGRNTESGSFSYLIAERALNDVETIKKIESDREYNTSNKLDLFDPTNWPRVIDNPTKIKNNVKLNVCAPSANIETWQVPKSLGKQIYHDARKADRGDLWALGKKSVIVKNQISDKAREKLEFLSKAHKKTFLKEQRKKKFKKIVSSSENAFEDDIVTFADSLATSLESSKKYKTKGKKAGFTVNPTDYDGK